MRQTLEEGSGKRHPRSAGTRGSGKRSGGGAGASGLTLVEVLMSMLVMGIGILGVVALLPLAFVRAVQATNLTNGTILRYNAESMIDCNPRLLLQWQPQTAYSSTTPLAGGGTGDFIVYQNNILIAFQCTTSGTSGLYQPTWNTTVGGTTADGTVVWTTVSVTANPLFSPSVFVIDPLGWNALGSPLQTNLGNNGAGAVDPNAIPRFNGECPSMLASVLQSYLPDSWVEQARAPVLNYTANSVTLNGGDLSTVAFSTPATLAAATAPYTISRVVMTDITGKISQTRIVTGVNAGTVTVSWSANDPLLGTFTPFQARVETQEVRYSWLLTVSFSPTAWQFNVTAAVFFHRPLVATDEQVFQEQTPMADGVVTPFQFAYTSGAKPFVKKGGFLFDCYFGRWYRIVNIVNDTGTSFQVFVDQPRQQADMLKSNVFGAVFMRGVVDFFPLPAKTQ